MSVDRDKMPAPALIWENQLHQLVKKHFAHAHDRVDYVYQQHFVNLKTLYARHWQAKADIPRDLANLPRALWLLVKRVKGHRQQTQPTTLSRKETAVCRVIIEELLQLPRLEALLITQLKTHPDCSSEQWEQLQQLLSAYTPEQAEQRLAVALNQLSMTQEGSRDLLMFITLGLVGRSISDKVAFGSALGLGSATATSLYISQQSFLGALSVKFFGAPAWVPAVGAIGGAMSVLLVAPLLAPLAEYGVNRCKNKDFLSQMIVQIEHQMLTSSPGAGSLVGHLGTYAQLIPDLIQVLLTLRR